MILYEQLSEQVIGAAIEVHKVLGPGLLESAYKLCMMHELSLRGIQFEAEVALPVIYKGIQLDCGYRIDILVEDKIVLELKSVETVTSVHEAQLLTYMKLSGMRVGLLINFNSAVIRNSITRRVLYNCAHRRARLRVSLRA
ncbi:MAG TPA: GxxExxY protein [Tepidisphaeraceae bacterium]